MENKKKRKKERKDWHRNLAWNQHFLAVYKFFQRNIWKSFLQYFCCVFLHQFHCQNNLMWAGYLLSLIRFKFFDMSISSQKKATFICWTIQALYLEQVATTVLCCNPDRFLKASDRGYTFCSSGIFILLHCGKCGCLFPS